MSRCPNCNTTAFGADTVMLETPSGREIRGVICTDCTTVYAPQAYNFRRTRP